MNRASVLKWTGSFAFFVLPLILEAKPSNGKVVSGRAELSSSSSQTAIHQQTDRAIVLWDDFSIDLGHSVQITQPSSSSASLHQVISKTPSAIHGSLSSNGQVYLLNPNGILIGPQGRIDTAGFVASTLNLAHDAFLQGKDLHFSGDESGSIINLGVIRCDQGDVLLFAPTIRNEGRIEALKGVLRKGAATDVFLQVEGAERVIIRGAGSIENFGTEEALSLEIKANGGNPYSLAIRDNGLVSATGFEVNEGRIFLRAETGRIELDGSISASQGRIETTADQIVVGKMGSLSADGGTQGSGGTILLLGSESVDVAGMVTARGGTLQGDGGFIEFSAASVRYANPVNASASFGKPGQFLLDPYNVIIAAMDPGGMDSWVDSVALGTTLSGGTSVTITTQISTNYDRVGSNMLAGDITVNSPVTAIGMNNGNLSLDADNNITINAAMSSASGTFDLSAMGQISVVSPGSISAGGVGMGMTLTGNNGVFVNSAKSATSTSFLQTNHGSLDLIAGSGQVGVFGSNSQPNVITTGTGSLFLTSSSDNTFVGIAQTGAVTVTTVGSGNVYIGNDSTATLSLGTATQMIDTSTAYSASFTGQAVTFRAGTGTGEGVTISKGDTEITANTGDISLFAGNAMNGFVRIQDIFGNHTKSLTAMSGSVLVQDGNGINSEAGIGAGTVNITAGNDLQLLGQASPNGGGVTLGGNGGTFQIGHDFVIQSGTGSSEAMVNFSSSSSLAVGHDLALTVNGNQCFVLFSDVVFAIGNDLSLTGGTNTGTLILNQNGNMLQAIGHDLVMTGGNDPLSCTISSTGASLAIGHDLTLTGGSAGNATECQLQLPSTMIGNDLTLTGGGGPATLAMMDVNGQSYLLINGSGTISGGTTGGAYLTSQDFFQMEVVGSLTLTGGTGSTPDAQILSSPSVNNSFQHVYVNGVLTLNAGTGTDQTVGIICGLFGEGVSIATEQRVDVGNAITLNGGSSNSRVGILGFAQVDPMGQVGDPSDSLGPACFIRSVSTITANNGSGTYPVSLEDVDSLAGAFFPFPPPAGTAYTPGNVTIEAGGDLILGTGITSGTSVGLYNTDNFIFLEANTQFAAGDLWPGKVLLGTSPPSSFPLGQGAIIPTTAPFNTTINLTTLNGNLSLLSAQDNTSSSPVDFIEGTMPNQFQLQTTEGNLLVYGFRDIQITSALNTIGNASLVVPATHQIHLESHQSISTTAPITVTGSGFSIGLLSSIPSSVTGDITLQDSITSSGALVIDSRVGFLHQTTGTLTADAITLTASNGIINTLQADMAVVTTASGITASTTSGLLNIHNTLVAPNTTETVISLSNGTGIIDTGRTLYFLQDGGASLRVDQALADGDISLLALDGLENIVINGPIRAGANLIGVAYQNLSLSSSGSVRGQQNVTLILDEFAGAANGGSTFVNASSSGGIASNVGNVAVYAVAGPQTPSGTVVPDLSTLGSYSSAATWDLTTTGGLASKYNTSWDDGGTFHGPGFGQVYTPGTGVFGSNVIWYKAIPTPFVPPPAPSPFTPQIDQTLSLLDAVRKWGHEIAFSIRWAGKKNTFPLLNESKYFLVDDPKQTHKTDNIYDRLTRRKFVYDY